MDTDIDQKKALARQFLTALKTSDHELLHSILAEDVTWNLPGASLISGDARGVEAILRRSQTIVAHGVHFDLLHILVGSHGVALSLHNTAHHRSRVLDEHLATVLTLQEGRITSINTYMSDVGMLSQFFA